VFFIAGLVRLGDKSLLSTFPLREQQTVQFSEAGRVVLCMEGPRLSKRFPELSFGLVSSDGSPVEGRTTWLHARTSAMSSIRMEMLSFTIPRPGHYTLYIRNLGGSQDGDGEHKVIFTKPHLLQTIGSILGIILSAGTCLSEVSSFSFFGSCPKEGTVQGHWPVASGQLLSYRVMKTLEKDMDPKMIQLMGFDEFRKRLPRCLEVLQKGFDMKSEWQYWE